MDSTGQQLAANLATVRQQMAAAAARAGRTADEVGLVGVTKYVTTRLAVDLARAGLADLGESRPQSLWRKADEWPATAAAGTAPSEVRWHLIGHLQSNKLARTLPLVYRWHSADSLRILEAAHAWAISTDRVVDTLLEVHVAPDATKGGFPPEDLPALGPALARLTGLRVRGLMTMARLEGGAAAARPDFARLRELRDELRRRWPAELGLDELSMGMSGDFEVAIEEGATWIRLGSRLFEGLDPEPPA